MEYLNYINKIEELISSLKKSDEEQKCILKAADLIAESIMGGGILQAYGLGHSKASAIEICGRAGGLIPTKIISSKTEGIVEKVEGTGTAWTRKLNFNPHDILVVISNSGNAAFGSELASFFYENNAPVILVTSKQVIEQAKLKNKFAKNLVEKATVILDNFTVEGDASISVPGIDTKIGPTSSIMNAVSLQSAIYEAIVLMNNKKFDVPIYKSVNVEGGNEFNKEKEAKYADRIFAVY
ncbi:hypothetical protein BH739_16345 [Enterococcus casseliflavus]|nr:hypothetical protein BH739_16345 [Enterococcus casseliflavus]